jgi:hypothetical protein
LANEIKLDNFIKVALWISNQSSNF